MSMLVLSLLLIVTALTASKSSEGPMTPHFTKWLKSQEKYKGVLEAATANGPTGSFGGKVEENDEIHHAPILFIHGNSDSALQHGTAEHCTGWTKQINYFQDHGYSSANMFAITYGDRNLTNAFNRQITCDVLMNHRRLMEAILEYTDRPKLSIIAHSMGVTIARKIIQGGPVLLGAEKCELGESMADRVDVFLAIAGANHGMCTCVRFAYAGACSETRGYFPGTCSNYEKDDCNSATMPACEEFDIEPAPIFSIDNDPRDAKTVISFWSEDDEVLGKGNLAWGRKTSLVPNSDHQKIFRALSHNQVKSTTIHQQLKAVRHRKV